MRRDEKESSSDLSADASLDPNLQRLSLDALFAYEKSQRCKNLRQYPRPRRVSTTSLNTVVQVTTPSNKLHVTTENTPNHFSSLGTPAHGMKHIRRRRERFRGQDGLQSACTFIQKL